MNRVQPGRKTDADTNPQGASRSGAKRASLHRCAELRRHPKGGDFRDLPAAEYARYGYYPDRLEKIALPNTQRRATFDRYGGEIIAEKIDFLSRPKSAEFESPKLVDRDDEIPF